MPVDIAVDKIETLCGATIQHGPYNDRIYLMKMGDGEPETVAEAVIGKARAEGYAKIFAKVPESCMPAFVGKGFRREAVIPGFFNGRDGAAFMGFYLDKKRGISEDGKELDHVLALARKKRPATVPEPITLPDHFSIRACGETDVERMANIYGKVFPTYPFPIQDPDYLLETMRTHVDYFGVEHRGTLVALSSAEMDTQAGNVEMTDFATLPDWRGNGFGVALLQEMETAMRQKQLPTAYTIARAVSPGMNITFAKQRYTYGGRLINNTNISGRIESMNIWFKSLTGQTTSQPSHRTAD